MRDAIDGLLNMMKTKDEKVNFQRQLDSAEDRLTVLKIVLLKAINMCIQPVFVSSVLDSIDPSQRNDLLKEGLDSTGKTAIMLAASMGDCDMLKRMLQIVQKKDRRSLLKCQDAGGSTALHMAFEAESAELTTEVIRCLRDFSFASSRELARRPIEKTQKEEKKTQKEEKKAQKEEKKTLKEDQEHWLELLKLTDDDNSTAVLTAVENNDASAIGELLKPISSAKSFKEILEIASGAEELTPLHWATEYNYVECLASMLSAVEDLEMKLDLLSLPDKVGETSLHKAASRNSSSCVQVIMDSLKDVGHEKMFKFIATKSNSQSNAIHCAVRSDDLDSIDLLMNGIDKSRHLELLLDYKEGNRPMDLAMDCPKMLDRLRRYREVAEGKH